MTRLHRSAVAAILMLALAGHARADEADPETIARLTGVQPEVKNASATIRVPRTDLAVTVDGTRMTPFQGLTTRAAFQRAGNATMVMGDLTLTENQVNAAMSAALDNGLEVTALHNHFLFSEPPVFFMHIGGMGTTEQRARSGPARDHSRGWRAGKGRHGQVRLREEDGHARHASRRQHGGKYVGGLRGVGGISGRRR